MEFTEIASGLKFPEGPVALPDGSLLVVEIERGTIARIEPDGTIDRIAKPGGGPNGAAIGPDGALYVANNGGWAWFDVNGLRVPGPPSDDYDGGHIDRIDLQTGAIDVLYTEVDGVKLTGPNDLVFDDAGGMYFTDYGKAYGRVADRGAVFYAKADGAEIRQVVFPFDFPNGIGLSPDGKKLYVAENYAGRLWEWDIVEPGVLGPGRTPFGSGGGTLLLGFGGYQLLDSLKVEANGNVDVATIITQAISVVSPDGELLEQIPIPSGDDFIVTNLAFGGHDLRTAYVTVSGTGRVFVGEWPRPGLKLNYQELAAPAATR